MSGKRVALVLAGCGVYDGTEIQEACAMMLELSKQDAVVTFFAPNIPQTHVIDHTTGSEMETERNVMVEAARIARGKISDLATLDVEQFDAIVIPGGFGAAKNLSSLAFKGGEFTVEPSVSRAISAFHGAKKPLGFSCIAPPLAAKVIEGCSITLGGTSGEQWPYCDTVGAVAAVKGEHVEKTVNEVHVDTTNKVVSTPAFMYGPATTAEVFHGIGEMIKEVLKLA